MSTALALIEPTQFDLMSKLASITFKSGYTKLNEAQLVFVMVKGYELGITPMQALDGIQVIQGKTTVSPQLMLALINRSGLMEDIKIDSEATQCTVTMTRKGRSPHTETFTMQNAQVMGLAGNHNWKAQPATMLKWRAVSACARVVFSDVIQGMYTPEEMGAEVSEDSSGDIVIESPAPILDADFKKSEAAVAELVEKNPVKVDEDGVISDEKPSNSIATAETDPAPVEATNGAAVAKSRFAGNGAPPAGEQKRIGNPPAPSYKTNLGAVKTAVRQFYKNTKHMDNSIAKLETDGKLTEDMPVELAIRVITNHKDEMEAPF